jgi:hypothetical protein
MYFKKFLRHLKHIAQLWISLWYMLYCAQDVFRFLPEIIWIMIIHKHTQDKFVFSTTKQNNNINIDNRFFKNMAKFKYLGMTVANQNLIQE